MLDTLKTISFVFLISMPLVGFAQVKSSFDFIVGLEDSFRYHKVDPSIRTSSIWAYSDYERNVGESKIKAWRIGFNYGRVLYDSWHMKLGVRVASGGFRSGVSKFNFYFLELPIAARYEFNNIKYRPFVEYGISPNVLIGSQISRESIFGGDKQMEDLNPIHMAAFISIGFNCYDSKFGTIFFQPIYRYHFTALQNHGKYVDHLYNFGLELGVRKPLN